MSTVPIARADFPPLGKVKRAAVWADSFLVYVGQDTRNIPRYVIRCVLLLLAIMGLLGLWEAYGDGSISASLPLREIDPGRVSSSRCAAKGTSDQDRWAGLAPALAILDEINPSVATWVRQRQASGALVFSDRYCGKTGSRGSVATYDYIRGRLTVDRAVFHENDGTVAAILCHEYRHSRQSLAKVFHYTISFLLTDKGNGSIIENDAELYEHETRVAIFGR